MSFRPYTNFRAMRKTLDASNENLNQVLKHWVVASNYTLFEGADIDKRARMFKAMLKRFELNSTPYQGTALMRGLAVSPEVFKKRTLKERMTRSPHKLHSKLFTSWTTSEWSAARFIQYVPGVVLLLQNYQGPVLTPHSTIEMEHILPPGTLTVESVFDMRLDKKLVPVVFCSFAPHISKGELRVYEELKKGGNYKRLAYW